MVEIDEELPEYIDKIVSRIKGMLPMICYTKSKVLPQMHYWDFADTHLSVYWDSNTNTTIVRASISSEHSFLEEQINAMIEEYSFLKSNTEEVNAEDFSLDAFL